jgi:RNA polymerase sigma factor (sigma-70 family)
MLHNDHKYIIALLQNNSRLIEDIYKRHSGEIKAMVLKNNGNETDAEDIFQEALIDLHRKALKGFELTCPLGGFLYLTCRNRWINELQRRKRNATVSYGIKITNIEAETALVKSQKTEQQKKLVLLMLNQLGENSRKLLMLSWSGHPLQKVADQLNISYAYMRKRKSECMDKLKILVRNADDYAAIQRMD